MLSGFLECVNILSNIVMELHINIDDLLSARTVESERIEYKSGWNPDAIYKTICAFANDFENIGGGYVIVGVSEDEITKTASRPVLGLTTSEIAQIPKTMLGFNNLIRPVYNPKLSIESIDNKQILVIWVPYQVPEKITSKDKRYQYYIRRYANSVRADIEEQQELISLSNNIPFDDRANSGASVKDISMLLVNNYLKKINSRLTDSIGIVPDLDILRQMELTSGPNEQILLRNAALLMFSENPAQFFPYTQVEVVEFPKGDAGEIYENPPITGPIDIQINRTLDFLKDNLIKEKIVKQKYSEESIRLYSYPYQAIEEVLVNCFYHRDYQVREPIEIRVYKNSIVFVNQGGPDRSINIKNIEEGKVRSRRYRNRRLGEFLKELKLTEGRATGIPTILKALEDNGSCPPRFDTDEDRSFFEVELFIHPEFEIKPKTTIDLSHIVWDISGIDSILDMLIENHLKDIKENKFDNHDGFIVHGKTIVSGLAGGLAGLEDGEWVVLDNEVDSIANGLDSGIAGSLAGGLAEAEIESRYISILKAARAATTRNELLSKISLSNSKKNSETYIKPLLDIGWLEMTIPHKPTSPNQAYICLLSTTPSPRD